MWRMSDGHGILILTQHQQRVAARRGRPLGDDLRDLYIEQGKPLAEVAAELGIRVGTVRTWLAQFGIETRAPGRPSA